MSYFLYILQSISSDKLYIGISHNPSNRLCYHNSVEKGFTARYRPWKIVLQRNLPQKKMLLLPKEKSKIGKVKL